MTAITGADDLLEVLASGSAVGFDGRIPLEVRRQPFEYMTSFPMERLRITLDDGEDEELLLKDVSWRGLDPSIRSSKPRFMHDPLREPAVYRRVLAPHRLDGGIFRGAIEDADRDRHWIFLRPIEGRELFRVGEAPMWEAAARWLARMHAALGSDVEHHVAAGRLLRVGPKSLRRWVERARGFAREARVEASERRAIDANAARSRDLEERLAAMPPAVIHGEFYASNVLVTGTAEHPGVVAVDWEIAAAGPGLIDLAALTSGSLPEKLRAAVERAYLDELGGAGAGIVASDFPGSLDLCRLYLAIQWLGWAPRTWSPPPDHQQDWLAIALELSETIPS